MAVFQRFIRQTKARKALLIKSLLLVATIRVLLWLVPTKLIQRLIDLNASEIREPVEINWGEISMIVGSVKSVSRFVPHATCLTQALAASILIRKIGQSAEVKIGVTKEDSSRLIAHAWLEKDGRIILGEVPDQCRFVTLGALSL